jgi:hypothetical protein
MANSPLVAIGDRVAHRGTCDSSNATGEVEELTGVKMSILVWVARPCGKSI